MNLCDLLNNALQVYQLNKPDQGGVLRVGTGRYVLQAPGCGLQRLRVGGVTQQRQVLPHHRRMNEEAVVARFGSRQEQGEGLLKKYAFDGLYSNISCASKSFRVSLLHKTRWYYAALLSRLSLNFHTI